MAGGFDARMAQLEEAVGSGKLVTKIEVDQVYARYQHERLDLKHPHGGGAKYLSGPLESNIGDWMGVIARDFITPEGTRLVPALRRVVEKWATLSAAAAPIEWGDLRNSMHPTITQGSQLHYDRKPKARRLTASELELKRRWHL